MASGKISDVYASLVKAVVAIKDTCLTETVSTTIDYYSWDSRGEIPELPRTDLIGLAGWSFKENQGLWLIRAGITLSTYEDVNLFREMKILDVIHDVFAENTEVPVYNSDNEHFASLVVSDFDIMPAGQSERRNFRPIMMELLKTSG